MNTDRGNMFMYFALSAGCWVGVYYRRGSAALLTSTSAQWLLDRMPDSEWRDHKQSGPLSIVVICQAS